MSCTTNSSEYQPDSWYFLDATNRTTIYCPGSIPINYYCNATIKANPDIAGIGIIINFAFTATLTISLAAIPAFYQFVEWWDLKVDNHVRLAHVVAPGDHRFWHKWLNHQRFWENVVGKLLDPLCDIQIVTGTAILIAGFAQWKTISFYHEQFMLCYWWLTLNSFWAAEGRTVDKVRDRWCHNLRRGGIVVSVVLFCVFQGLVLVKERDRNWDFLDGRSCYRTNDKSGIASAILWLAGASLYGIAMMLTFRTATKKWLDRFTNFERYKNYCKEQYNVERERDSRRAKLVFWQLLVRICWCMSLFTSLWSYGSAFGPLGILEVIAYFAFSAWSVFNIIDLKLSNRELLDGSESAWGFGQSLPVVLLALTGFMVFEAAREVYLTKVPELACSTCNRLYLELEPQPEQPQLEQPHAERPRSWATK